MFIYSLARNRLTARDQQAISEYVKDYNQTRASLAIDKAMENNPALHKDDPVPPPPKNLLDRIWNVVFGRKGWFPKAMNGVELLENKPLRSIKKSNELFTDIPALPEKIVIL